MILTSLNDPGLLQFYLTAEYPCSYLAHEIACSEVAVPQHLIGAGIFDDLLHAGFRRSGNFVYRPGCRLCNACIAVRVCVADFIPNRSQKRSWQRHCHLEAVTAPLEFDPAHFELYRRYQKARHPNGGMDGDNEDQYCQSLLQSQVRTSLFEFREHGKLLMVSIVDTIEDGLSSVYTFFDPDLHGASLGTYNVLWQIELCKKMELPHLYLGYWIEMSEKMAYKIHFRPIEGLIEGHWQALEIK